MRWTLRCRAREEWVAGRVDPRERNTARKTSDARSVRQSRVVLTPVAGVKSAEAQSRSNRTYCAANSRDDGDKQEFVAEESAV
jgi:hypothetical protein